MNLDIKIAELAKSLEEKTITRRRDFHRYPETGWTEFRTASIVLENLISLGYDVKFGDAVIDETNMMGVPSSTILEENMKRAISQGANSDFVAKMAGGKTGVIGIMNFTKPGPTVALRFDMDCNDIVEAADEKHRPSRDGFASMNPGCMHACGHDGHTAAGLAIAEILSILKDELAGTIKLIFQPAEEGVRGAKAMLAKGAVDHVDFFLAAHLMMPKVGYLAYDVQGFLATSKFDATFTGVPSHAGAAPEIGKNSLLAAAIAAINLQAIPRHSDGISRVNVGVLNAGTGRNVVPANAVIKVETRGATSKINDYIYACAEKIIKSSAAMYDNTVTISQMGGAANGSNSPKLTKTIGSIAKRLGIFNQYESLANIGGSEDSSYFMDKVQKNGGQAAYMIIGASLTAINHNLYFDFDEKALILEAQLIATITSDLLTK
ncbi:aminobenzoyl-glutamate utilization protein A [Propionispira arboris]|uniref:Aminobenzoyl-glutamate utilization protein A n=1 Tax=Propionispira arboris TaxID=84035 RepID=A0A1H7BFZ5_9FIRM|nr:amidohydrolase [Propionispira arboris]SEJ75237.1 aminobenzoyl-glutamate utilization protein A [Propionispira arboris]